MIQQSMCGWYQIVDSNGNLTEAFMQEFSETRLRYNVGPMQIIPTITKKGVVSQRWGFKRDTRLLINARGETVHRLPAFRDAFRHRRCLIPASGYYEWHGMNAAGKKQPYLIRRADHRPLAFAGIWERDKEEMHAVIITNDATPQLAALHDRMPLWLSADHWQEWLDEKEIGHSRLKDWQEHALADEMETLPVSTRLNSVRNDDGECLIPDVPALPRPAVQPNLFTL